MIYESCCPLVLPRSCHDPREIKKKKKRNPSTHTHTIGYLLGSELSPGNCEWQWWNRLHPTPRPENFRNLSLREWRTTCLSNESFVSLSLSLLLLEERSCCNVWLGLVTMAKVEWNQSYNFVWTRAVAQVNSIPRNCSRAILDWSSPKMPCCSLFDAMRRFYTSTNEGSKAMRSFLLNHLFEFFAFLEKK